MPNNPASTLIDPIDQARAARLCLAFLDGAQERLTAVLDEAHRADRMSPLIASLTSSLVDVTVHSVGGVETARSLFQRIVLDAGSVES